MDRIRHHTRSLLVALRCVPLRVHQDVFSARHVFAVCATVVASVFLNLSDEIVLVGRDDRFLAAATDRGDGHGVLQCGQRITRCGFRGIMVDRLE